MLSGLLTVEAILHKRLLSLFGNITRLEGDTIKFKLATRQLLEKSYYSHNWFIAVAKVLIRYELPGVRERGKIYKHFKPAVLQS